MVKRPGNPKIIRLKDDREPQSLGIKRVPSVKVTHEPDRLSAHHSTPVKKKKKQQQLQVHEKGCVEQYLERFVVGSQANQNIQVCFEILSQNVRWGVREGDTDINL